MRRFLFGMLIIAEAVTNHAKMPMDLMITTSGKFREVRSHCFWQIALTVVCGTGLGLLLMPYGTMRALCGIVAGVCVGDLARTVFQLRFIPKEVTGIAWQKTAWRITRMFVTTVLIAAPCLLLVDPPQRFFSWAMYGVIAGALCFGSHAGRQLAVRPQGPALAAGASHLHAAAHRSLIEKEALACRATS